MKTRYFQYPLQKTLSYCSRKHFQTSLLKTMNGIGVALIAPTVTLVSFIALVARKSKAESWGIMSHSSAEFIGGNPNHADDDSNYSQLTLLEKRNRNIERNKNFFMTLFGSSDPGMSHSTEVDAELKIDSSLGKIDSIKLDELILCEEKKRDDIVASLSVYFPHREDVLKDLMGYMNPDFVPAPALLIHGPTGCGKSAICGTMTQKMHPHTYARVSCDSFNTSKQLLKAIWIAVITAKFKFDARDSSNKSMKKFELFRTSLGYKVPTTFGDLAALLGPFLDSFLGCQKSFYSTHNIFNDADTDFGMKKAIKSNGVSSAGRQSGSLDPKTFGYSPSSGKMREGVMYLLLDRIDCVERLEKGLTNCLLRISELSHPRIKVIAILVNIPPRELSCSAIEFPAYTPKQLEEIMISRATRAGFRKNDSETFALENLSDDIEAFTAILLAVLPQLLVKTRHVAELWENMMSIWGIIFYSTYHLQFIYASQSESLDTTTACVLSSSPSGARFQLDLKALKLITQEILLMPVAHVIEIQPSISGVGQKVKRTVKPAIDHSKYLRQRRLFSNSMGADTLRPELQQALPYDINSTFDSSLLKSRQWCATISLSEKYVLLAAYLASTNRKESDDNVFAGKQRLKRRKIAAGHDDLPEGEAAAALSHMGPSSSSITRTFTLDRLVSIFGQISSTGGVENLTGGSKAAIALGYGESLSDQGIFTAEQIATSYGDSDLFGTIKSMEQRNTLIKASNWSLERPMYISSIDSRTAEQVALSISFPLQDYVNR